MSKKGRLLRTEIDKEYQARKGAGALKELGSGVNDFSPTVLRFIPIGTTFDEAEETLREAGFTVGPREQTGLYPYTYVHAVIEYYDRSILGKVRLGVFLMPKNKDDWTAVTGVIAEIVVQNS
jgi:hypothetical protein